jgi:hypothetical protein
MTLEPALAGVAARLAAIPGIRAAREEDGAAAVVVEVEPGVWVAPAVERSLRDEGVLVAEVDDIDLTAPDFSAEPALTRLRTVDGVLGMLRHLRGFGALEEIVGSTPDGFGGLVASLGAALRDVRFYRLSPGRLPSLVRAIAAGVAGESA